MALQVAEQMADFLLTGAVANALNMPSVTAEEAPRLRPYMKLAEQLGSFAGQLTESGLKGVTIEYEGHAAELNTRPLTAVGAGRPAGAAARQRQHGQRAGAGRERDIEVTRDQARPRRRLPDADAPHGRPPTAARRAVAGTLFGGDKPRIVEIKGIQIEAELGRHMLYVTNQDKPGFIGRLGTLLGEAGINIATFHLGRSAPAPTPSP